MPAAAYEERYHPSLPSSPSSPVEMKDGDDVVMLVKSTMENCQKLADWVQRKQEVSNRKEVATQSTFLPHIYTSQDDAQHSKYVSEENIRLRAILHEVTNANKRWQQYYTECQRYMQKLVDMVRELRERDPNTLPQSDDDDQHQQHVSLKNEQRLHEQLLPKGNTTTSSSKEEVSTLRHLNEELLQNMDETRNELDQCKRKLSEITYALERSKQEHNEHVELLKIQLQGHRDDWEAECNERKSLKRRNAQLQEEMQIAEAKVQELQYRVYNCTCSPSRRSQRRATYNIPPNHHCTLIARSPTIIHQTIVADGEAPEPDGPQIPQLQQSSREPSALPDITNIVHPPNTFACPACRQTFNQDKHVQFLQHMDKCSFGPTSNQGETSQSGSC